jgi:hypothetical protein
VPVAGAPLLLMVVLLLLLLLLLPRPWPGVAAAAAAAEDAAGQGLPAADERGWRAARRAARSRVLVREQFKV